MVLIMQEEIFVARAPGRLDVMGGIADYSGSVVLQVNLFACYVNIPCQLFLLSSHCGLPVTVTFFLVIEPNCLWLVYAADAYQRSMPCCCSEESSKQTEIMEACSG